MLYQIASDLAVSLPCMLYIEGKRSSINRTTPGNCLITNNFPYLRRSQNVAFAENNEGVFSVSRVGEVVEI